jgi:hypothetical protein
VHIEILKEYYHFQRVFVYMCPHTLCVSSYSMCVLILYVCPDRCTSRFWKNTTTSSESVAYSSSSPVSSTLNYGIHTHIYYICVLTHTIYVSSYYVHVLVLYVSSYYIFVLLASLVDPKLRYTYTYYILYMCPHTICVLILCTRPRTLCVLVLYMRPPRQSRRP